MKDILVVDDDTGILDTFRHIFEMAGYSVDTAGDGSRALDLVKGTVYRVALLDIKLPDMEGTALLSEIKKIRPGMKCIMVTGYASLDNAVESINSGANAYILKPVKPADLLKMVAEKIEEQKAEEDMTGEQVSDWIEDQLLRLG